MKRFRTPNKIAPSEITPKDIYLNRRHFMQGGAALAAGLSATGAHALVQPEGGSATPSGPDWLERKVAAASTTAYGQSEKPAPYSAASTYNNFYEFGMSKSDPSRHAGDFTTDPWNVTIGGECEVKGTFALEDILKGVNLEERIYRLRCVEAWSMVIPWIGFSLSELIARFKPLSSAKYVEFITAERPKEMPGQRSVFSTIRWPYREGLRMDEATHPLTLMAVGMYGDVLPNQNGAPLRLVVPWKYGFKSIKSIVAINFTETMPETSWNQIAPHEYGFYANVNPDVDHPRWSQASERRLPGALFGSNRIDTQMFNGYAEEVASLYSGMDLRKWY
ncbi:MAG TPA: protein-methionine-sulfoxide reductase catalytic subunit MsrP [Oceanospirillales bacterium]|nr:protein-methionine-sulfoxide reductase catalytic subunit MsrP [Oceanospirillaceae bacterium]HBS42997.1 protein-methionine-sulfoxide reductase catalytic subunit MsrP [Oceanospirillales bacterium]|tara:strand:- start:722 stop:1723 length:1002 start_codon:yes stop_codon:yes gene_type:complete